MNRDRAEILALAEKIVQLCQEDENKDIENIPLKDAKIPGQGATNP